MKILIKHYVFEGPFYDYSDIDDREGIYVLLSGSSSRMTIEQIGHLGNLRQELQQLSGVDERYNPLSSTYSISVFYASDKETERVPAIDLSAICAELADWISLESEACGVVSI